MEVFMTPADYFYPEIALLIFFEIWDEKLLAWADCPHNL